MKKVQSKKTILPENLRLDFEKLVGERNTPKVFPPEADEVILRYWKRCRYVDDFLRMFEKRFFKVSDTTIRRRYKKLKAERGQNND